MQNINIEQLMALLGALGTLGSILAGVLPKHWLVTQVMARLFADPRNIRGGSLPAVKLPPPDLYGRDDKTPAESPAAKRPSDPPPPETWR